MEQVGRPLRWRDAALPAGIVALGAAELWTLRTDGWLVGVALEALAALLLVGRARAPWLVLPALGAILALPWVGTAMDEAATPLLFIVVGIFALGRHAGRWQGPALLAGILLLVALDYLLVDTRDHNWTDVVFVLSLALPPFVFGRIVRRLDAQAVLLRSQQEQIRQQAVRAERDRIARELHDVVAHSVSAMVVQTAAAQDLVHRDPDRAAALLGTVADTGRQALAETGRLLHLVRDEDDELGLSPAPGLAEVPALVERARDGGLRVDAELHLPTAPLHGTLDVSAYRVVQEALTNALRHGSGTVRLSVAAGDGGVTIRCANPTGGRGSPGSGLGLAGMAERVALLGGTLDHGQRDGVFELEATLPLAEPVA